MIRTFEYDDYPHGGQQFIRTADRLKSRWPNFKCNVFAIPSAMTDIHWRRLLRRRKWMRVCPHGMTHKRGECRTEELWKNSLGLLDYVRGDSRWTKCFKAPWYGYSKEFVEILRDKGFTICLKTVGNDCPFPAPEDVMVWNIEDARMQYGFDRQQVHVESHPVYSGVRSQKSRRTQISRRNIRDWTRDWKESDEWGFVDEMTRPLAVKVHLGCGPHVWDDWLSLDPRSELDPRIIKWDFSKHIPLGANRADVALCSHVFEYLADTEYAEACLDVWRILRPGAVFRLSETETEKYIWRKPGQRSRGTGEIKSMPTEKKVVAALEKVGFEVHGAKPGSTRSPHSAVLQGDSRHRRWARGEKFYVEAVKNIEIPDLKRAMMYDPRATRTGEYILPVSD